MIIFDIETGPRAREEIGQFAPTFEAPANYKDEAKIAAYIAEKAEAWFQDAALSAVTGKVLAIGYIDLNRAEETAILCDGDEATMLDSFWNLATGNELVGFNSNSFDIPFMIRRSFALGVSVPADLLRGRYLPDRCIDIMDTWKLGVREDRISLDKLARFLGVGQKSGSGAHFAETFGKNPEEAFAYLENDLRLTLAVARKLGVVSTRIHPKP